MSVLQLEAQVFPCQLLNNQLFCHRMVTSKAMRPLMAGHWQSYRPTSTGVSNSAWLQAATGTNTPFLGSGYITCTEQWLRGPEDAFKVTKLTKSWSQIFKILPLEALDVLRRRKKNTGRGCGERQAGRSPAAASCS